MYSIKDKQRNNFKYREWLLKKPTIYEKEFINILDGKWIYYIFQKWFIKWDCHCIVDFYLPKKKVCIEIDGLYHDTPEQKSYDKWRDKYLTLDRWFKVIRIKNEDINSFDIQSIL